MDLYNAAKDGNLERVQLLLGQGTDKDMVGGGEGETPLFAACANGHLAIAQLLVEQGADMEKTYVSWTPLNIASNNGHLDVVRYLLEQGADRDKANANGYTPLLTAVT